VLRVRIFTPAQLSACELRLRLLGHWQRVRLGLNGFVELEMYSESHVAPGDCIQIDAYEPGEEILEAGVGEHNRRAAALDDRPEEANFR
jgi:hypothetical protein